MLTTHPAAVAEVSSPSIQKPATDMEIPPPRIYWEHERDCRPRLRRGQGGDPAPAVAHRGPGSRARPHGRRRGLLHRRPDPDRGRRPGARRRGPEAPRRSHEPLRPRRGRARGRRGRRTRWTSCWRRSSASPGPADLAVGAVVEPPAGVSGAPAPPTRPPAGPAARAAADRPLRRAARSRSSRTGGARYGDTFTRPAPRAGRRRLRLRPGVAEAAVRGRPRQHDRPRAQHHPRAAARAARRCCCSRATSTCAGAS